MDYEKIKEAAQNYQKDMVKFLRAIVKAATKGNILKLSKLK